jgi:hypothetical protein
MENNNHKQPVTIHKEQTDSLGYPIAVCGYIGKVSEPVYYATKDEDINCSECLEIMANKSGKEL